MKKIPYNPELKSLKQLKPNAIQLEREKELDYNWDGLKESIRENGLLEPISVEVIDGVYHVMNGAHRMEVLKELYSEDYLVPVIVKNLSEKFRPDIDA